MITATLADMRPLLLALALLVVSTAPGHAQQPPWVRELLGHTGEAARLADAGQCPAALGELQQATALADAHLPADHPVRVVTWRMEAVCLRRLARAPEAAERLGKAVAMSERLGGLPMAPLVDLLDEQAQALIEAARLAEALPVLRRAATLREAGPKAALATTLTRLAYVLATTGQWQESLPLARRAVAVAEQGGASAEALAALALAQALLATVELELGDLVAAERIANQALARLEQMLGPQNVQLGPTLVVLGDVAKRRGDWQRAGQLYQRALDLADKAYGPESRSHPPILLGLATVRLQREDIAGALTLLQRGKALADKQLAPADPARATFATALGWLHATRGEDGPAETLLREALALQPTGPEAAKRQTMLALVQARQGKLEAAETLVQQAAATQAQALGPHHPELGFTLGQWAGLQWARGRPAAAVALQAQSAEILEQHAIRILATGSEADKLRFVQALQGDASRAISLFAQGVPADPQAVRLAAETALRRKGRVLDALVDTRAAARRRLGPEDARLLDTLTAVQAQLAALAMRDLEPRATPRVETEKLELQAETLEKQLADRVAASGGEVRPVRLDDVTAALPADAALLEYVVYRPFTPAQKGKDATFGPERLAVFVLRAHQPLRGQDLGPLADIDRQVSLLREALQDPRKDAATPARALGRLVLVPTQPHVGPARLLLVAPDGPLHLVPFAALQDDAGHWAVERWTFAYLTSGRDVLRNFTHPVRSPPVVLANPDFQTAPDGRTRFTPLPGAEAEGKAVAALLPGARLLLGAAARESALEALHGPEILHLATHGFFEPDAPPRPLRLPDGALVGWLRADARPADPLRRTAVALAGANAGAPGEDGLLTALEAASLDLQGTRMVVLSACQTGLGDVRAGEGVLGLRRALALAGAESQLMSLWQVDDAATRDLMTAWYTGLQHKRGRADALRDAQLAMLRSGQQGKAGNRGAEALDGEPVAGPISRAHPYFWAAFVPIGDWRPLH